MLNSSWLAMQVHEEESKNINSKGHLADINAIFTVVHEKAEEYTKPNTVLNGYLLK